MRELLLARNTEEALVAIELGSSAADLCGGGLQRGHRAGAVQALYRSDCAEMARPPFPVTDGVDNWEGRIPGDQMPTVRNPERDWVGSGNHRIAPADFPWTYSTHFSPFLALSSHKGSDG